VKLNGVLEVLVGDGVGGTAVCGIEALGGGLAGAGTAAGGGVVTVVEVVAVGVAAVVAVGVAVADSFGVVVVGAVPATRVVSET